MNRSTAIAFGFATAIGCSNAGPVDRGQVGCPVPEETTDAGTTQPGEKQCLRTGAYLASGVLADLTASVDPSLRGQGYVTIPDALQMYLSYGVDGVEVLGHVSTWSDSSFDGTPASSAPVVKNLRLQFGGALRNDPNIAVDPGNYWTAKRLYDAMVNAKESQNNAQTVRTSPSGFIKCETRSDVNESAHTCTITNVVMMETRLAPCSQGFLL